MTQLWGVAWSSGQLRSLLLQGSRVRISALPLFSTLINASKARRINSGDVVDREDAKTKIARRINSGDVVDRENAGAAIERDEVVEPAGRSGMATRMVRFVSKDD